SSSVAHSAASSSMASAGEGPTALTLTRRLSARQLSEYENCMRLSAEGKISAKNAFALNLIDYLEGLVKGDCEFSNFQLASSSLDAGAKIYAGRVDAVHREAYKVMAELGRSSATAAGGVDSGVEDAEGGSGEPVAPKRSRTSQANQQPRSRKSVDPARLARIRLKPSSLRFDLDPLFHQQAAAYDESAAWELRLNAARVADNDCEILLDSDARLRIGDADEDSASTAAADCGVFTPALQRLSYRKLAKDLQLCCELSELRLPSASVDIDDHFANNDDADDDDDVDHWQAQLATADGDAAVVPATVVANRAASIADFAGGLRRFLGLSDGNLLSTTTDNESASTSTQLLRLGAWWPGASESAMPLRRLLLKPAAATTATHSSSSSIGEGLLSPVGSSVSQSKGDQQQPPSSCSKQRRRRSELVSKRRQRRLAEAATADALNSSASSAFPDGRRRSRRLAGQDAVAVDVAPTPVAVDVVEQHKDEDLDEQEHTDAILEAAAADDSTEVVSSSTTTAEAEAAAASLLSDEASSVEVSTTRDPFADGVLEPPYKVARLDLAYARTAKRVDAKRLKRAMWQLVGGGGGPSSQSTTTSLQSSSFTQLLQQLPGIPAAVGACSGGELSVQLVFNCLLHLAGEQNLQLESQPDLSDILVSGNYGSSTTTNTTSTSSNNSTR
ncbi:hypothetical protein BOX15_Mlig020422g3, partial [Macrostomum lignano]